MPTVALMSTCGTGAGVHSAQACSVWVCYVNSRSAVPLIEFGELYIYIHIYKNDFETINSKQKN